MKNKNKKSSILFFPVLLMRSSDIWLKAVFHQARGGRQKSKQKLPWEINTTVLY